jgi:hypothetical protein
LEEVSPQHKMGWYPQIRLTKMDKRRHYSDRVGDKVYQPQLVVVQETSEEVVDGHIEPALEEGGEDDLLFVILRWEHLTGGRLLLHLRLGSQQPAIHQCLNLLLDHHRGLPNHLRGWDLGSRSRHFFRTSRFGSKCH